MASILALNRKKGSLKAQLTRIKTSINDTTIDWTKIMVETKLKGLEKIASGIDTLRMEYFSTIPDKDDTSQIEEELFDLEAKVDEMEVSLQQMLTSNLILENKIEKSDNVKCKIKLPEIPLPQFNGKYEEWSTFKAEFCNLVSNNEQLSDTQKLHYLHAALKGPAKCLENPEDTFQSLFTALETRFENKRIIVSIHIKAILEIERIMHESPKDLRNLVDAIHKNMRALNNLGFERNKLSDILVTTIILDKLDKESRKLFELSVNSSDVPEYDNLMSYLEKRSQTLESINKSKDNVVKPKPYENKSKSFFVSSSNNSEQRCVVCHVVSHPIYLCSKFQSMSFNERFNFVKRNNLCILCLKGKHYVSECRSKNVCSKCFQRHSTLLHKDDSSTSKPKASAYVGRVGNESETSAKAIENESGLLAPAAVQEKQFESKIILHSCLDEKRKFVVLPSAIIMIKTASGKFIEGKALLDSCSQISCLSSSFYKKLGFRKNKVFAPVSGLNENLITLKSKINALISNKEGDFVKEVEFFIVPKITEISVPLSFDLESLGIPQDLPFADVNFYKSGPIDLLLGAELFFDLLKSDKIRSTSQNIVFQDTVFGFVATGVVDKLSDSKYCGLITHDNIDKTLQKFWLTEEVADLDLKLSSEEQFCEKHFEETHYRKDDGQYVVSMPMEDTTLLGESQQLAVKRLNQLWDRLRRDLNFQELYSAFMQEYRNMNHMELIKDSDSETNCYYLPHHGVYRPEKTSTRLRVVYNASAPTTSGLALNDILLKGKIPQQELFSIMLRFRKHRYAFTADIEKMYRMIEIDPSQRDLLRILWKDSFNAPIQVYRLTTVSYGTSNAPYLATRTLKQLALDESERLPLASSVTLTDFYIDDILTGESSLEKAKMLQSEIIGLLQLGKMKLHKWCANHRDLMVQSHKIGDEYSFNDQPENDSIKTLGVLWNPSSDCFLYKIKVPKIISCSKRDVLSLIARIFDPLGLIGPVVTRAKIILQKLWLSKIDWHEPLPETLAKEWTRFMSTLSDLERIEIPRFVFREDRIVIHGYADASSLAYATAIYVQSVSVGEISSARLLCSKSRVAPIKTVSIPRLELNACLLLAKLMKKVLQSLNAKIDKVVLWTDSTISLAWINKSPHLLKTYVSNRVAAIQRLTEQSQWKHVSSKNNPADINSRGLDASEIVTCDLWWHGPQLTVEEQPDQDPDSIADPDFVKELKPLMNTNLIITEPNSFLISLFNISNSYMKLIRILSFVFRFCTNIHSNRSKVTGPISVDEIRKAEEYLIKEVQWEEFAVEIGSIVKGKQVNQKSKLKSLNAFIDEVGILRVGGRLAESQVSYNSKFPIILPSKHKFTYLLMYYYHRKYLHLGPQALLNVTRQKYWPINGRNLARKIVHECVQCFRHKPASIDQLMGSLPPERVNAEPTFNKCGLDLCGPFLIKEKNQRKGNFQKMFVAVFVCFVTRAIHLEIVSDLSTEALIATLKRFFSRRGKCSTIFSDNATNFIGAKNELKRLFKLTRSPEQGLKDYLLTEEIEWRFIPPRAPHFGGLWEAGVKSFKTHFKKTVGDSKLTMEEFLTLVTQIEGILNSRPITPLSSEATDLNALTPGHFLIGRPIIAPVEPDISSRPDNRLSRWERVTKMVQNIWKRWQRDYLSQLHERTKWQFQKNDVKSGMIVLVREDNLPVGHWMLGRIEKTILGSDRRIRVVEVRTAKGLYKRPIHKLSILPIEDNNLNGGRS